MPYTGQTNALELAHGHGVVTYAAGYTLTGIFFDGAPSIGICRTSDGHIVMSSFDLEGKPHGLWPCVDPEGSRSVYTYHHGTSHTLAKGKHVSR